MRERHWLEYENGRKIREGDYTHNIKEGIWHERRSFLGGQTIVERVGQYKNGLKHGEWKEFFNSKWIDHNNAKKQSVSAKMFYVNDTLDGYYIRWEINSRTKTPGKYYVFEKGNYIHGLRDGEWFVFDEEHTLEYSFWNNGVPGKTIVSMWALDELTKKYFWISYEVTITQWYFQEDMRKEYWIYETVKPISENSDTYYRWEGLYGVHIGVWQEFIPSK